VIFREAHRYWPSFLRFPFPGYSLIAAHSGLCLDLLNSSNLENDRLQQSPVTGRSSHLWAFVPDQKGCNLCSGRVLDVVEVEEGIETVSISLTSPASGKNQSRYGFSSVCVTSMFELAATIVLLMMSLGLR